MSWFSNVFLGLFMGLAGLTFQAPPESPRPALKVPETILRSSQDLRSTPRLSAPAYEVVDLASGTVLASKEADAPRPMASLTKLMTALVIMRDHQLTDIVPVGSDVATLEGTNSQQLGLVVGDKLTLDQALHGLLIYSANDIAVSLAQWDAGSQEAFVAKMNAAAKDLGMSKTNFANAVGLDGVNHVSSAHDLALLSAVVLQSATVREIATQRLGSFTSKLGKTYRFTSTNQLLANPAVHGLKTGFTAAAGECLITYATQDGRAILTVVLGSPDRFAETTRLLNLSLLSPQL